MSLWILANEGQRREKRLLAFSGKFDGELLSIKLYFAKSTEPGGGAVLQQAWDSGAMVKEGKQAVKMTRLSCHRFRSNEVRL